MVASPRRLSAVSVPDNPPSQVGVGTTAGREVACRKGVPMARRKPSVLTPADGGRSDPVGLDEALERLLPYCEGSPHKVAERINLLCRTGELALLVGGVAIAPAAIQNGMIGIIGRILPTGAKSLEGQIRGGWDPRWREKPVFAFERATFEKHLLGAKRKSRKWVQEEVLRRIDKKHPKGLPGGLSITQVQRKVSEVGFRPGWDAVKAALIAIGYILPKD